MKTLILEGDHDPSQDKFLSTLRSSFNTEELKKAVEDGFSYAVVATPQVVCEFLKHQQSKFLKGDSKEEDSMLLVRHDTLVFPMVLCRDEKLAAKFFAAAQPGDKTTLGVMHLVVKDQPTP